VFSNATINPGKMRLFRCDIIVRLGPVQRPEDCLPRELRA
jgi:hypothetical protein